MKEVSHVGVDDYVTLMLDLDTLYSILHQAHKDLSRFDVYKSEIETGHLQWGLVHTEKFFKENAKLMEGPDGDFALVKVSRKTMVQSIRVYPLYCQSHSLET